MKKTNLLLLLFLCLNWAYAQLNVKSFKQLPDLDARIDHVVENQDGEKCALIKIDAPRIGNLGFSGSGYGISKVIKKLGEYWVYVSPGERKITIKSNNFENLFYKFPISIREATSYSLVLTASEENLTITRKKLQSQYIIFNSQPEKAIVYIDGNYAGKTPYSKTLSLGEHSYKIVLDNYKTEIGNFVLNPDKKSIINAQLKPNFGFLSLSVDQKDVSVIVDDLPIDINELSTKKLSEGVHHFLVSKELFTPQKFSVTIKAGQTVEKSISLVPNFASVTLKSKYGEDLYINNVNKGKYWKGKLEAGIYIFEAKADFVHADLLEVELKAGENREITLEPIAKYGIIDVNSKPMGAKVYLDEQYIGETPLIKEKIIVGKHKLTLEKEGSQEYSKNITVLENEKNKNFIELKKGFSNTSNSTTYSPKSVKYFFVMFDYSKTIPWGARIGLLRGTGFYIYAGKSSFKKFDTPYTHSEDRVTKTPNEKEGKEYIYVGDRDYFEPNGYQFSIGLTSQLSKSLYSYYGFGYHSYQFIHRYEQKLFNPTSREYETVKSFTTKSNSKYAHFLAELGFMLRIKNTSYGVGTILNAKAKFDIHFTIGLVF